MYQLNSRRIATIADFYTIILEWQLHTKQQQINIPHSNGTQRANVKG